MLDIKKCIQLNSVLIGFVLVLNMSAAMAAELTRGTIQIDGFVDSSSCVVSGAAGGISVPLGSISMEALNELPISTDNITVKGKYTVPELRLTGCMSGIKMAKFASTIIGDTLTYLQNQTGTGFATGVGVSVTTNGQTGDGTGWLGASNGMPLKVENDGAAGNYVIRGLTADYVKISNTVGAGDVLATGVFTITLN